MARMYPAALDEQDVQSHAELKLFDALRDQLDDSWEAYHSTSWTLRDPKYGARDGEIDFVLCQPDLGFLCVEAKSGGIRFKDGGWVRLDHGEEVPYAKDPFRQAVGHAHALRKLINGVPGWRGRRVLIGHAVAFPEIPITQPKLPPTAPRQIVIDRSDVQKVEGAIRRALAFHAPDRNGSLAPGDRGAKMLRELLVPPMEIKVPLAEKFLDEELALIKLTEEQSMLLRRFADAHRMAISGCAGSGKTMLAVEQAKWLVAKKGLKVAFVCFNRQLASHLKERERGSGVEFFTFHGLCMHLGHRAGLDIPRYKSDPPQGYWLDELPDVLADAAAELGGVYDALMVDEAQDLHTHWLTALMYTLRNEKESYVWLFMDANQRVYEAKLDVPPDFFPFHLTVNCRNTQAIHREVMKKYEGEVEPEALGPEGRTPELVQTDDPAKAVAGAIERLCGKEQVPPQDVVVLSSHGWEKSAVARSLPGRYQLVDKRNQPGKRVFFSSIRAFKGLESKVVIICELEDIEDESLDAQIYVGMSRAVNHCVVVAPAIERHD